METKIKNETENDESNSPHSLLCTIYGITITYASLTTIALLAMTIEDEIIIY